MADSKAEPKKSNVKLNKLLDIEKQVQNKWYGERIFEEDAPSDKWYVVTFFPHLKSFS